MKTAVEWLYNKWAKNGTIFIEDLEQAKEMEKEQRQVDTNYGYFNGWGDAKESKEPIQPILKQD